MHAGSVRYIRGVLWTWVWHGPQWARDAHPNMAVTAVSCETVVPLENITGRVLAKEDISEDHLCLPDPTMFTEK